MHKVNIKPLSINNAFKGQRFKTPEYVNYERSVLFLLPKVVVPAGNLKIDISLFVSNTASDIDNPVKPFLDILQKKYGFNDCRIYELNIKKNIVEKGKEHTTTQWSS